MKILSKQNLKVFLIVFLIVFFSVAMSLQYSPLETDDMPHALKAAIDTITFPAVSISFIPSFVFTFVIFCNAPGSCPGLLDAHSFENAVIMILISFFSAPLYGFTAVLILRLFKYLKFKIQK